ncbi:MAG: right-handed parallel beta-helix repeat-containing protein [Chitinispirillaceae bacterium]|nr:right-handed parallel beta-helix repeat-containing protein [Chitinispirillaceae bacterium]
MVRFGIIMLLVIAVFPLHAARYHVSSSGSDQNSGQDPASAWRHLSHARSTVHSGDTVLLKRGDVFRESQGNWPSSITLSAYGDPSSLLPTISGAVEINGWTRHEGPVYVADCPEAIAYLFVNDSLMPLARYPDTGWLRIDTVIENSDGTNTSVLDNALASHPRNRADYWADANIRWRRWSWWFETRRVASYEAAGRLRLSGQSFIHLAPCRDWGYYLDNKLEELDAPGEWYQDAASGRIYLHAPGGGDPGALRVEGSLRPFGLDLSGCRVERIRFTMFRNAGLRISGSSAVDGCRFENIGSDSGGAALQATWEIQDAHITGNVFFNNFNLAISWNENTAHVSSASFIEHNTFMNTGCVPGYGGSGSWHAAGIIISNGRNVHIRYNTFTHTGYAGVILGSERNIVENNVFDHAMATLNDGGAIYTNCHRSTIRHNIILNTEGDLESSGPWSNLGHAIWPEFLGDFRENDISYNTCAYSGGFGIFLPNNFADTLRGNILYGNCRSQLDLEGDSTNSQTGRTENLPQAHIIDSNICVGIADSQATLLFQPGFDFGTLRNNWFCNPWRNDSLIQHWGTGNQRWTRYWKTIPQWQAAFPWADGSAKTDQIKRPASLPPENPYATTRLLINSTSQPLSSDLSGGSFRLLDGTPVMGAITIPAYYSVVVVCLDTVAAALDLDKKCLVPILPRLTRSGNHAVALEYRLNRSCGVRLELYDLAGRLLATTHAERQLAGTHRMRMTIPSPGMAIWRLRIETLGIREEYCGKTAALYGR